MAGVFNKSPTSDPGNNDKLLQSFQKAVSLKGITHILIMGDFHMPEIKWNSMYVQATSETFSSTCTFFELTQELFLYKFKLFEKACHLLALTLVQMIQIFFFLSIHTGTHSLEDYEQAYIVQMVLQDESIQVIITCTVGFFDLHRVRLSLCTGGIQLTSRSEGQHTSFCVILANDTKESMSGHRKFLTNDL